MKNLNRFSTAQKVVALFAGVIVLNFIQGVIQAVEKGNWQALFSKASTLVVLGIVCWFLWDNIKRGWDNLLKQREATREHFELNKGNINIKDAAIFSLTWSREIYRDIPEDRKPLVKTSFTLIGIAIGIVTLYLGKYGMLTVLLISGLILAGVNLLIWVVGSERQEKDRLAIELETARKMQLSLMPAGDPLITGFDISGCCIPAMDVGGDLFDFVWAGKEHNILCIPIVDVSGKGMDAALTAVYTSGALVSEAQHEEDVVTVVDNLNSAVFSRRNRSRFVSLLMVSLDVSKRRLEFVNAGQTKPLLIRDNQASILSSEGARFPLGVMQSPVYKTRSLDLLPGDTLLLYTDGLTEAMDENQEMFGEERMIHFLLTLIRMNKSAREIVISLKDRVLNFSGTADQHDDLTIVVIRVCELIKLNASIL